MQKYAAYYREHLLNDIMPFWDKHCIDNEFGGYRQSPLRFGHPESSDKYIRFQAQQTYVYALLYNEFESRPQWLDNALHGLGYLTERAYAGSGRFHYLADREGSAVQSSISLLVDCYAVQALSECYRAGGGLDIGLLELLGVCYNTLERNVTSPYFTDLYEYRWSKKYIWHDIYLTALDAATTAAKALGADRTGKLEDHCTDRIFNWFVRSEHRAVFDAVGWDKRLFPEEPRGSLAHPGRAMESMRLCLRLARRRGDDRMLAKALDIVLWTLESGTDDVFGGMFSHTTIHGGEAAPLEDGTLWHDKVWRAHAEALSCCAEAYVASGGKPEYLTRFEALHEFCRQHFHDREHGEWHTSLHRDGTTKNPLKDSAFKSAYYPVRAAVSVVNSLSGTL